MWIKKELIGTIAICQICKNKFIIQATTKRCNKCLKHKKTTPIQHYIYNTVYRLNHKDVIREERNNQKKRHNEETLLTASNTRAIWSHSDIEFLINNGKTMTAREIARKLGRTYDAVITKSFILNFKLMTADKLNNKVITK